MIRAAIAAICAAASLTSFAADRTISADYALTADETVDGVLTVDSGATVDLAGHNLTVKGLSGGGTITYPGSRYRQGENLIVNEAFFWLDASAADTLTVEDGKVVKWVSRIGNGNYASRAAATAPSFAAIACNGMPAVDFGATGSGKDMDIATRLTTIRTVFWVLKIEKNKGAFWLGDTSSYHFHRNESSGTEGAYAAGYSNFSKIWCGEDQVAFTDFPDATKFIVVAGEMKSNSNSNRLTQDRSQGGRNGGKQLSELICFSRVLTEEERLAVTDYLTKKWIDGFDASANAASELHIDTSSGNVANSDVAISGNVRLVVEGGNTFTASKSGQTYIGGTEVSGAGTTLALGTATHPVGNGNATQTITLGAGAKFNFLGNYNNTSCSYNFTMEEGSGINFKNGSSGNSRENRRFHSLVLNGDANLTVEGSAVGISGISDAVPSTVKLNGNSLVIRATGDGTMRRIKTLDDGKIVLAQGSSQGYPNIDFRTATLEFRDTGWMHFGDYGLVTGGLICNGTQKWSSFTKTSKMDVYGRYIAGDWRPPFNIKDGATLDLSEVSGTWNADGEPLSNITSTKSGLVTFPGGGTINIDIGERQVSAGDRLVQFVSEPVGVAFTTPQAMTDASLTNVVRQIDGIWYLYAKSTKIPYARWHIDATTPANSGWKFYNAATGAERTDWEDGVTDDMEVRFSSYAEWTAIQAQNVSPDCYVLDGAVVLDGLSSIWNLTGISVASGTTLNLNGYSVALQSLESLEGFASITDGSQGVPGELHVNTGGGDIANSATPFSGNMKLVIEGGHTFTASKANQSYTGGTEVSGSGTTLALGTAAHPLGSGNATQTVTLGENAHFNAGGYANAGTCVYNFVLGAGSTMAFGVCNSRALRRIGALELLGDASASFTGRNGGMVGASAASPLTITLNNHVLSLSNSGTGSDVYWQYIKTLDAGTIRVVGGMSFMGYQNTDFTSATLETSGAGYLHFGDHGISTGGFVCNGAHQWGAFKSQYLKVYGRYTAAAWRPPLTMMGGSTLDLSGVSGTWNADGKTTANQSGPVSFASGATIGVDLSGRTDLRELAASASPYVVTWSSQPNATFTLDAETAKNFKLKPDGTGIKLVRRSGFTIIVR